MNWRREDNRWTKERPITAYLPWQELKDSGWKILMEVSYREDLCSFASMGALSNADGSTEEVLFYFYSPSLGDARTRAERELSEVMAYRKSIEWLPTSPSEPSTTSTECEQSTPCLACFSKSPDPPSHLNTVGFPPLRPQTGDE
jgi:hypothetical protein